MASVLLMGDYETPWQRHPEGSWAPYGCSRILTGSCGQEKKVYSITGPDLPFDHALLPEDRWTLAQLQLPEVCRDSKSYVKPERVHTSPQVTNPWEWKEKKKEP